VVSAVLLPAGADSVGFFAGLLLVAGVTAGLLGPLEDWAAERRWGLAPVSPPLPRRARRIVLCVGLFFVNALAMELCGEQLLDGVAAAAAPFGPLLDGASSSRAAMGGRLVVAFVAGDLCGYLLHRAMHASPLLYRFHRLHHDPVELDWLDGWRLHPVDFVLQGLVTGLPAALLGVSLSGVASIVVLRRLYTSLLHANVALYAWGGPLRALLATPAFHRLHHSHDPSLFGCNLGGTMSLWDRLFGTLRDPAQRAPDSAAITAGRAALRSARPAP
jgi:sterol desaturase/sphingolipid hydroxylase (fatty acid hydroxylase superfamily)